MWPRPLWTLALESGANTNGLFTESFVLNVDGRCVLGEEVKLRKQRDWWLDEAGVSPVTLSQKTGKLLQFGEGFYFHLKRNVTNGSTKWESSWVHLGNLQDEREL